GEIGGEGDLVAGIDNAGPCAARIVWRGRSGRGAPPVMRGVQGAHVAAQQVNAVSGITRDAVVVDGDVGVRIAAQTVVDLDGVSRASLQEVVRHGQAADAAEDADVARAGSGRAGN